MSLLWGLSVAAACTFLAPSAWAQIPLPPPAEPEAPPAAPAPSEPQPPSAEPQPPSAEPQPPSAAAKPSAVAAAPPGAHAVAPAKTDRLSSQASPPDALEDEEPADVGPRPRRNWYGWQTLTADGASVLLIFAGAAGANDDATGDSGDTMVTMGLVGYEFAPGIIHFAHGNTGRGFASFGLRLGMPLAGAFLGAATASGCDGFECEAGGAALGLLLGMGGAMAIDAAVFAFDDPERPDDVEARLVPQLLLTPSAAWVGLGGRL